MIHQLLLSVLLWQAPSFIEQSIATANEEIAKEPNRTEGYNDLAIALVRKFRQTGDMSYAVKAEAVIAKSLKLDPVDFGARRARVAVWSAQHRYEDTLEEAEALRKQRPDDNPIYGFISEANIAIGNYAEAEKAVQRMLDLRSVNGPGFEAGATVRELIGFPDAAIDWWKSSLNLVSDRDIEERAYIYSQMARIYRETGKYASGVECAEQALKLEPGDPLAVLELARLRLEQKQPEAAIALLGKRGDAASLYWLAVAQERAGLPAEAGVAFEKRARAESDSPMNVNSLLIRYLADNGKAQEAVAMAEGFLKRRHDLFTRQAYAIALAKAGKPEQAMEQIRKAMEPGYLDVRLYFDAGMIARQRNDTEAAARYFRKAFELGSGGFYSGEILKQLGSLSNSSEN